MSSDARDAELQALLDQPPVPTRRPTVPALEAALYRLHPVLDHGFVRVVDYMGDDAAIVQAARVSYGSGTRAVRNDRGLIRYLMRHRHTTPFEMCELKLHIKLPIFVARQWIRHRTANVNEYSARYSILDREFYLPSPDHLAEQSASNKQGRDRVLTADESARVLDLLRRDAVQTYDTYHTLLNDTGDGDPAREGEPQLARELARMNLTLNYYTQWYWKIDLHNLLHFLSLRRHPHAQYEIRAFADVIGDLTAAWVPLAWEAFLDYREGGAGFSREELDLLRAIVAGGDPDALLPASGLSFRERKAFRQVLALGPPKRTTPTEAWDALVAHFRETHALHGASAITQWDQQTNMPPKAAAFRGEQVAAISKVTHARSTDPRIGAWLDAIERLPDPTPVQRGAVRNIRRDYERDRRVPAALVGELAQLSSDGFGAWMAARKSGDFGAFAPTLAKLVDASRRKAAALDPNGHPYDVLMQDYDPSLSAADLRATFGRLRAGLVELLEAVRTVDPLPAHEVAYDTSEQLALFGEVASALGYDLDAGRVDLAAHPFTVSSGPGDTRITVRCHETDLLAGLGGAVHEAGHALYEQGLPWHHIGTGTHGAASICMHESQSRFWENFIGRSRPFFGWLAPRIDARFGGSVDPDALYRAANRVVPGLIRVAADEVTYNLHIIARFGLELALIEGSVEVEDLPAAWNQAYADLLGITPPDDVRGVLQDVHWSTGMFGYFPSYTVGNLYAASLGVALVDRLPDLWERVAAGDFAPIREWLRDGLHRHGHVEEAPDLLRAFIGERDHVADLLDHVWARHGALHGLTRPG